MSDPVGYLQAMDDLACRSCDTRASLQKKIDGLAGQVVLMREALKQISYECVDSLTREMLRPGRESLWKAEDALALPLPQAAAQVAEWREKAGLLDWFCAVTVPGFTYTYHRKDYGFGYVDYDIECARPGFLGRVDYATKLEALRAAKEAEDGK